VRTAPKTGFALKPNFALKMGAAALAISLSAGNAAAAPGCARPQDVTALRIAALQQQLMVAALTCHDTASYNRFVTSHQGELQKSDQALMSFFLRQDAGKGLADYNAYKTKLANASSLRSLRDPQFCRGAKDAFDVTRDRDMPLADLMSRQRSAIETSYASCTPDLSERTQMADATPTLPPRRQAAPDSAPTTPVIVRDMAARAERAPATSQRESAMPPRDTYDRDAYDRDGDSDADTEDAEAQDFNGRDAGARDDADAGGYAPPYAPRYADAPPPRAYERGDDGDDTNEESAGGYYDGPAANNAADAYRGADAYRPHAYRPHAYGPHAYGRYAYGAPARPRQVRGPDGRWYLVLPYGRYFANR